MFWHITRSAYEHNENMLIMDVIFVGCGPIVFRSHFHNISKFNKSYLKIENVGCFVQFIVVGMPDFRRQKSLENNL